MTAVRRHTANRDRHVLRVGLHRRSHQRSGYRFAASPHQLQTGAAEVDACAGGRLRQWRLRVLRCPAAAHRKLPLHACWASCCCSPFVSQRHAFGIQSEAVSYERAVDKPAHTATSLSLSLSFSLHFALTLLLRLSIRASRRFQRAHRVHKSHATGDRSRI